MLKRTAFLFAIAICLAGCALPFHPFGTPISSAKKAEQKVVQAEAKVGSALQEEVHKVDTAIDQAAAGNPHGLEVAKSHSLVAKSLVDQLYGTPAVGDETKWRELILRQTSLDQKVRDEANEENRRKIAQIAKLSGALEDRTAALDKAEAKALDYAGQLQEFKDRIMKWVWIVGGLFALFFLGQFLQLLANFNPAFHTAANAVNAIVNPVMHASFAKARKLVSAVSP